MTVNRPEKRTAMDIPTRKELRAAFEDVVDDDAVRVIVLRGAGEGNFIAGGDLQSFAEHDMMSAMEYVDTYAQGLYNYVANVPKPVIAAIDGHAFGGGLEIACAADIRVARSGVKMGLTEVGLGIIPAGGGTISLTPGDSLAADDTVYVAAPEDATIELSVSGAADAVASSDLLAPDGSEFVANPGDEQRPGQVGDRYGGSCQHFDYVRTDQGIQPYCGLHDELMDDMDACEEWTKR